MPLYRSKSDIWYYVLAYYETMAICLFGDALPDECRLMKWGLEAFGQVYDNLPFYIFNYLLLLIAFVYVLSKLEKQRIFRLSSSPGTIVKDFFQTMKGKLKEEGIELDDDIAEYVHLLLQWGNETLVGKIDKMLGVGDNRNIVSMRDKLSDGLDSLDGKLYVLIDDIDRLQKDEIFEVLKLIRHTADFRHVVYVVTCDKQYVVDSLKEIPIARPSQYLQKIFQLELSFPMFETYLFTHLFNTELASHTHYETVLQNQLNRLEMELGRDKVYLRDYFTNFREVKRLVNEFILNLDYIVKQGVIADFNIRDLFLILLFEFTEEEGYQAFRENVGILLHTCSSDNKYVELTDDKDKLKKYDFSDNTLLLLRALFPKFAQEPPRNSIRRQDKLYNYFSYRPYAYQMSLTDFSHLMKTATKEDILSYVKNSNVGVFSKDKSMCDMMREQWLDGLDEVTVDKFITMLTAWTTKYMGYDSDEIGQLYRDVLAKYRVNEEQVGLIKSRLDVFFETLQEPNKGCCLLQKIYCKMMPCLVRPGYEGEEEYFPECIYGAEELREKISRNALSFLQRVKPTVNQLLENSRLHQFVMSSIVYNASFIKPQFDSFAIEDDLISYFSQDKEKNDIRPFMAKFKLTNYSGGTPEEQLEAMQDDIRKHFASVSFYKRFLQKCFVHNEEEALNKYFRENRLDIYDKKRELENNVLMMEYVNS